MESTSRMSVLLAASVALLAFLGTGAAVAAAPDRLTQPRLKRLLLTLPQITTASGTGYPAQASGVTCATSAEIKANVCYQKSLHSDRARSAGAPWVTRLNVLSFATAAEARQYAAVAGSDRPQTLAKSETLVVAFDPTSMISDGLRMEPAPEAYAFQAVGPNAIWSACADPSGNTTAANLASCAKSLAAAQAKKLP